MSNSAGTPFDLQLALPSVLDIAGEFGAELNSVVPFVYWLHQAGLMQNRQIRTYPGMRSFYFFLDADQIVEKNEARRYVPPQMRPSWLPTRNDHASRRTPFEMFPDYRAQFRDAAAFPDGGKPLLILHNKYSVEWGQPPINFLPLQVLAQLFEVLGERFRIVYMRPGIRVPAGGYSGDHQPDLAFDDAALLARYAQVELFEDLARQAAPGLDYNAFKLKLYANAFFHLTVQGGNAHMASLFSGSLVTILHRMGQEIRHSYQYGHFGYAANPAPTYLICRDFAELGAALPVMITSTLVDGRVMIAPAAASAAMRLSPTAQCGPERLARAA